MDLLIFEKQVPLVLLDVVGKDRPVPVLASLLLHGGLQSLQQLFFRLVQILAQRFHPVELLLQVV
jgi:hypothetical protein